MTIEPGVYKLTERIENTSGCTNHRLWTSCNHIPPADQEWDGSPERSLEGFLIVVQDVEIMGHTFREAVLQSDWMSTGFFIDEVPGKEHFPDYTEDDMDEHINGEFQSHSWEPAPQEFLDTLEPVKGKTLEELMQEWAGYQDLDPAARLLPINGPHTAFKVVAYECRNDPEFMKRFTTGLRRLLLRDSNTNLLKSLVHYTDNKIDDEKTQATQVEVLEKLKGGRLKQYRALSKLDADS